MLAEQIDVALRHELLERLAAARVRTDEIFALVRPDYLYDRPIAERHRIIFYIGHLEAFDWNLLRDRLFAAPLTQPDFDRLFAFGIDPVAGGLPSDQPKDWPSISEVRDYVAKTRRAIDEGIERSLSSDSPDEREFPAVQLLQVAIEHRLMHAETLAYMLHQLPLDRKIRPSQKPEQLIKPVQPAMVQIPEGRTTLGLRADSDTFGWDNEFESYQAHVPAFEIDKHMVTNGQFLDFLKAGGYDNRRLWEPSDWAWKSEHNIAHPGFWRRKGRSWQLRTMFDEISLPTDWPVYVSHAEAVAYARWAGKALPTEEQWQRAAYGTPDGEERQYPWGSELPNPARGNFNFRRWDPSPVAASPEGQSTFGVQGLAGNGWEWTSSLFAPFPGFKPFPFYLGYSADFFDGKHFVMKGGSAQTAACMLRRSFRNWFQPHYPHVYAGFRCVSN
jgi:gamma-glutamyl hercynylcysteine S-oxide synthase